MPKQFYAVLANTIVAGTTNTLVWFAVTFWVYLETRSVIAMSIMAGIYLVAITLSGVLLGTVVDRYPKKTSMVLSSLSSLIFYVLALGIYTSAPPAAFTDASSPLLWGFITLALGGGLAGHLRGIALSTLVTILIPAAQRDKANGMVGTANGVAFLVASLFSGVVVGFLGIFGLFAIALVLTLAVTIHVWTIPLPGRVVVHDDAHSDSIDLRGSIRAIQRVPGLFGLIFFNCFNNFLGGVYMSLMDAYGLELVSVQVWGVLWGFLSLGFIVGGLVVAKVGLGASPLRALFLVNVITWTISAVFTLHASIVPLAVGMFLFLCLMPVIEAAEQTILQKVIPPERQGRVFGFAHSVEQAASPLTAFLVGPIASYFFIPFMTTGAGVEMIGPWFGVGTARGIALLFTVTGVIGLAVTLIAMRTRAYRALSAHYQDSAPIAPVLVEEEHSILPAPAAMAYEDAAD